MKKQLINNIIRFIISIVISFIIVMFAKVNSQASGLDSSYYNLEPSEILELQKIALAEAGTEGELGMALVMQVVVNRVNSDIFPNTVQEVIEQEGQFETYKNGIYDSKEVNEESQKAYELFLQFENSCMDIKNILFFENVKCENTWASNNRYVVFIYNNHRFYE